MSYICYVIIWICFYSLSGITLSSEKESFAATGCIAVLEWNLGILSEYEVLTITVDIQDNNGSVIISHKENKCSCKDATSMKCTVSERDRKYLISVIIFNVTKEHRGNYTALIEKGLMQSSVEKQLLVIDKPQIVENKKPVLHESFSVTCNTSYDLDCLTYHWRQNGVYQNYTASIQGDSSTLTFANLTMMDNSSKFTCRVGIEKCADVDFTNRNCSSEESDLYTVLPYYGPINVSLNINESDIYLMENQTFRVKCSADCFPKCTFQWKGYYINVEEEELKISSFVSRMSGGYACIVRNPITDTTVESNPFFLHYVKVVTVFSSPPGENQDPRLEQYWLVPAIVSGFLLSAGFVIFFKCRRKIAARGNGRRPELLYATENGEKNDATFYPDTGTQSNDLNKSRHDNCGPNLEKGIYSTIDESAELVYCYARDEVSERHLNETGSSTGHGYNSCTTSMEMCTTVKADVHVPDKGNEDYLTPQSYLSSPVDMCQKGETNQSGTDQTTLTPINEFSCPNEVHFCQDEKIEVSETDHSYITPIV